MINVVNENCLQNVGFETKENKTFLSGEDQAGMSAVTEDINLSVHDAFDETQVANKTNMSYDMTYVGKEEK